ncbi:Uncharacterised protein [Mycobacterium tuberculosis]|nr:Uncharacterised protein [Mycobacterium tuberculosis]
MQVIGTPTGGQFGQLGLGGLADTQIHRGGQLLEEGLDLLNVFSADLALTLSGRGRGQLRWQRFTGQGAALTEVFGFGDAAAGLTGGDV